MDNINGYLQNVLESLYNQTGRKHDCHYKEGYGALFVPEGYPLHPRNVIHAIDEMQIKMMSGVTSFTDAFNIYFN
jgi:hypothetical protein